MNKDRKYGGSSRLRSPSPRRRGFSPPRRSRIGESCYSSPRGRRFDASGDRREGRYYRRREDKGRDFEQPDRYHERKYGDCGFYQRPSHGGTRLSGYDDGDGGRDRDKDKDGDHLRQLHQQTTGDSDRGRSFGRGGMRLSGYDASGGRGKDRDMEADHPRMYQLTGNDGDRCRSFGHGGTKLSGYGVSGGRDKDRDTEADYPQLYQPTASVGDHSRRFDRGGMRLSGYDMSGGKDKDRDTEADCPRLYQPGSSDADLGRSFGCGSTRLSGYDASGGRDGDRDMEADSPQRMYKPGGYGEDSWRTYKYGDMTSRYHSNDLKSSNGSKGNTGQWPEGSEARNGMEYDHRSSKFVDDNSAGYGLDTNPPVKADKGRFYSSSSYQMGTGTGTPPTSSSRVITAGGGLSQSLSSSLPKDENLFINGRQHFDKLASDRPLATFPWPEARGAYMEDNRHDIDKTQSSLRSKTSDVDPSGSVNADREDNMSFHYRSNIDMMHPYSRLKASDVVLSGSVKADIISSSRDFLPPAEVSLGSGTFNYTGGYNEHGAKSRAKTPVDHDGRSADFRKDSLSYLASTKERLRDYNYPTGGHVERVGVDTRSKETYRKIVDVVEDKYGPRNVTGIGTLEPIVGNAEGLSDQGYLREKRLLEPLATSFGPRPEYYDTQNLVEKSCQEVKSHHYGSPRSPMRRDSYLDHGISRLGEPNIDHQDGNSWTPYKHTERLPTRDYGSILDTFEHRQEEFILDKEKLPKPLKRTFEQRGDAEKEEAHQYGGTWNDLEDVIEPWRHNIDSKFRMSNLKSAKSKFGNAKNVSNSSSQHHFYGTGSVSGPSHYSDISGHRDIKSRLGPVPHKLHVSQRLVNKYKPSLKKRLGPVPQNNSTTLPPWLRKKNAPKSHRIQDSMNGVFADQGGEPPEDDVTQTKPPEDDVTQTKLEPPENSVEFKQMVSNAFFKFVKQLNETPAKRRKYMEHINAHSLTCIVCGSVSEEFGDTESLVLHAFTSQKVGVRSQHLGLHKALCALMGWRAAELHDATWICETLTSAEHSYIREDLILWPPVVIIHNSTIGNQDKDKQIIVSVQELEEKLREKGFGEKTKLHRGKPLNQSVMVVQFGATYSGLQEAERLHKMYLDNKHGRDDLQLVIAGGANNGGGHEVGPPPPPPPSSSSSSLGNSEKREDVMYGYMGIAEDMDEVDVDTKRRCLVKSKRDIQDLAQAPL